MLSFKRVKCRELKYSVNGVPRRMSLTNNSPFRKSYFSLSIQALPYCKLELMHIAVTRNNCSNEEQLQEYFNVSVEQRWHESPFEGTYIKNQYQILPQGPQGMSVYPPKTYWPFCTMVTVFSLPSHLPWKVVASQPCEVAL